MNVIDAANFIISLSIKEGHEITSIGLQKLLYISHGICLAHLDSPLIDEGFAARISGPICKPLWKATRKFFYHPIDSLLPDGDDVQPSSEEEQIIYSVWSGLKSYSSFSLIQMTIQRDSPWAEIYHSENSSVEKEIPDYMIKTYYLKGYKKCTSASSA